MDRPEGRYTRRTLHERGLGSKSFGHTVSYPAFPIYERELTGGYFRSLNILIGVDCCD
jgi:hypothetical protein